MKIDSISTKRNCRKHYYFIFNYKIHAEIETLKKVVRIIRKSRIEKVTERNWHNG